MSYKISKTNTDNPYVDEVVYYAKILAAGTVLKMQDLADKNETVESAKKAGLFIACKEGTASLKMFNSVSRTALQKIGIVDDVDVMRYQANMDLIPLDKVNIVAKQMMKEYIDSYEELNSYYRMLNGLPAVGDADYIDDWLVPDGIIIDTSIPIHEMSSAEIGILETYGIIDELYEKDPVNHQYMKHLGSKGIDYYFARKANKFDVLYIPEIEHESIFKMYRNKIDENKMYVLRAVYSEAFKYDSDYYDNIMAIFIVLITMIDIISRVQEFIARREIFDIRSIEYIFKSYGVPYFAEIPIKYQSLMVKNLHTLLKYKSTHKCMVDICSLFGFDDISIFKYYLLKVRKTDVDGNYIYAVDENGDEDLSAEYDLKFIKLPIDDDVNEHIRLGNSYLSYDEVTSMDPTWDGGLNHEALISEILKQNFNLVRSKYMSIDTVVDLAKMSTQQTYFLNMFYNDIENELGQSVLSSLLLNIPYIDQNALFSLSDAMTALSSLSYIYKGMEDIILDTPTKILYVNGFNFNADISTLVNDLLSNKAVASNGNEAPSVNHAIAQANAFIIPNSSILSIKDFISIYKNNIAVRDELIKGMKLASDKDIYYIYSQLYDALMTSELTLNLYKDSEGNFYRDKYGNITYTAYLQENAPLLYNAIINIKELTNIETIQTQAATLIDNIVGSIELYLETDEFSSIFNNLPTVDSDSIKRYMLNVLNFYKSYKVDFVMGFNTIYSLDDKYSSYIKLLEKVNISKNYTRSDILQIYDYFNRFMINKTINDNINLIDRIYIKRDQSMG